MRELRRAEPAVLEQLQVDRHGGDPLVAADHVGRAHEVVVHTVGKVVGRDAVGLEEHDVHDVFRQLHLAFYDILIADLLFGVALGLETQDIGLSFGDAPLNFLEGHLPVSGVLAVVAGVHALFFLLFADGVEFLRRAEAGVCQTFFGEFLCEAAVNVSSFALLVGTVGTGLLFEPGDTFIHSDAEVGESFDDAGDAVFHFSLLVGVLDAKEENAAGRIRRQLCDIRGEKAADVQEAGRARRESCDSCAFRETSLGVHRLIVFRGLFHIREQQCCEFHVVCQKNRSSQKMVLNIIRESAINVNRIARQRKPSGFRKLVS